MPEYCMRSIDFAKVGELLKLIINSPGKWSAAELNRAATDSGIFITDEQRRGGAIWSSLELFRILCRQR